MKDNSQSGSDFGNPDRNPFWYNKTPKERADEFIKPFEINIKKEEERKRKEMELKIDLLKSTFLRPKLEDLEKISPPAFYYEHVSRNRKVYNFSPSLESEMFNRIDIADWKYTANFIINYCNTFSLNKSEQNEIDGLLKSRHLSNTCQSLHREQIFSKTFVDIIIANKPLITIGLNSIAFLRKNVLFLILYTQIIKKEDKKNELDIDKLAKHWLKAIIAYELFSNLRISVFLKKEYSKNLSEAKISTIKYLNNTVFEEIVILCKEQSLDFSWISSIRSTYSTLFGDKYKKCNSVKAIEFPFFSRDELDMIVYIIIYNIGISNSFPIIFENLIDELLVAEGISSQIGQNILSDLASLEKLPNG